MRKICDNIYWIGVRENGISYNAYLVTGDKNVLIDTVPLQCADKYIDNIKEFFDIKEIDCLICNHTEPDRAGAVNALLSLNPNIEIFATIAGLRNLKAITNREIKEHVAKEGKVLDVGKGLELEFCIVPNMNWPDTMVTYERKNKCMFSCDIFSSLTEGDTADMKLLQSYYKEYFGPYRGFANTAMDKISKFDINVMCTGQGTIIERNIDDIIDLYKKMGEDTQKKDNVIIYASRYGSTKHMADIIQHEFISAGKSVSLFDVNKHEKEDIISAVNNAASISVGTPTINRNADKAVWDILTAMDCVTLRNIQCMVFGSYGWGGEGTALLYNYLEQIKLKPFEKPFNSIFNLSQEKETEFLQYVQRFIKYLE